jgi:hypothetical protein
MHGKAVTDSSSKGGAAVDGNDSNSVAKGTWAPVHETQRLEAAQRTSTYSGDPSVFGTCGDGCSQ